MQVRQVGRADVREDVVPCGVGELVQLRSVPVLRAAGQHALDRVGVNFVDVVATDGVGEQRSVTCPFIAGSYLAENALVTNGYNLALRQPAVDDGIRSGGSTPWVMPQR